MTAPAFIEFPKIPRLFRAIVVTEKIDGTNACVHVPEDPAESLLFGSRTRWITPTDDNFGFARWATEHAEELRGLGHGTHFGEWWGAGVQRRYGLDHKRWSLFNVGRWNTETPPPACCHVVPVLARYESFVVEGVNDQLNLLRERGSVAAPGFMRPEGVVVFHAASGHLFKATIEKDEERKSAS